MDRYQSPDVSDSIGLRKTSNQNNRADAKEVADTWEMFDQPVIHSLTANLKRKKVKLTVGNNVL